MCSSDPANEPSDPGTDEVTRDLKVTSNSFLRVLWLTLGLFFTAFGFIGAFLPVMPTTIFLIIATYFFSRSSPRFYTLLLSNPTFGPLIRDWRAGLGIPLRAKILAVTLIALTIGTSIMFAVPSFVGKLMLGCVGVGVSLYLMTRSTKPVMP